MKPLASPASATDRVSLMPAPHQSVRSGLVQCDEAGARDPRESVLKLQMWIAGLVECGDAHRLASDLNILRISSRASSGFCVGTREQRWFLGVGAKDLGWFLGLPWFHIAIKRGSTNLNLVCEQLVLDTLLLPAFCISLHASKPGSFDELSRHHLVDVRESSLDEAGRPGRCGQSILRTIDVRVTDDESTMNGLLAGKFMTGHTNRSVFRSIRK